MATRKNVILLFLCCFLFSLTRAQDYSYTNYDIKEGLAGSVAYCAVQDKDGFIWIGTEPGLSRFDGTHFKNFTIQDGLPDNEIIQIFVDSKNRVWCIPFKNTICYYSSGEIRTIKNDSALKNLDIRGEITGISENKEGDIIILERNKIDILSSEGKVTKFASLNNKPFISAGIKSILPGGFAVAVLIDTSGMDVYGVNKQGSSFIEKINYKSYLIPQNIFISPTWFMMKRGDSL